MSADAILEKQLAWIRKQIGQKKELRRGLRMQADRVRNEIAELESDAAAISAALEKIGSQQAA